MTFYKETVLRNGVTITIRNGEKEDAEEVLQSFIEARKETEYLAQYPEECCFTPEGEGNFLSSMKKDERSVELLAVLDGRVVGTAGLSPVGNGIKVRHRSEFGVSILKSHWGMGIGKALTLSAEECARKAGYSQIELQVVEENKRAVSLYSALGFRKYGMIPRGLITKDGKDHNLVIMAKLL